MKVCVDIQASIAQRAGVGRYVKSLVDHLPQHAGADELELFYFDFKRTGSPFPDTIRQRANRWFPGRIAQGAWKTINWPPYNWLAGNADVYHFPNFIRPPMTKGKSVVTIHDVSFLRMPETTEAKNLQFLNAQLAKTVREADAIITISAFTARETVELLHVPQEKLFPIHLGLAEHVALPDEDTTQAALNRLGIDGPYIFHVGTLEPRKNLTFLIDVFEQLKTFDGTLVVAGMKGWKYESILQRLQTSPQAHRIKYLEYVDEDDLTALYRGARLFAFPSLYEGFGFPPLEAMTCGTAVISAATGSLPEVLGDKAELVDGFDVHEWATRMDALLSDGARLQALAQGGPTHAARFTWDDTARKTWDVYRKVIG